MQLINLINRVPGKRIMGFNALYKRLIWFLKCDWNCRIVSIQKKTEKFWAMKLVFQSPLVF